MDRTSFPSRHHPSGSMQEALGKQDIRLSTLEQARYKALPYTPEPSPHGWPRKNTSYINRIPSLLWWWPEFLAASFSVISLCSILAIASHYGGHKIQHAGLPKGLTLNGLIALLSTVARAALLIPIASALSQEAWLWLSRGGQLRDLKVSDDASRGAWGSVILLFHMRRSWLTKCAALVTTLSLLFGTFTQQLITIKSVPLMERHERLESVPWSSSFDSWRIEAADGGPATTLRTKTAFWNGIVSDSVQPLGGDCPTGNCSWPITPSVAVCGGCVDSALDVTCASGVCLYKTPSGYNTTLKDFSDDDDDDRKIGHAFHSAPTNGYHYNRNSSERLYIANFEIVGLPQSIFRGGKMSPSLPVNARASLQKESWRASECALWACVQAYKTERINGKQSQIVQQTWEKISQADATRSNNLPYNTSSDISSMDLLNFNDTRTMDLLRNREGNETFNIEFIDLPKAMNTKGGYPFFYTQPAHAALGAYLHNLVEGEWIAVNPNTGWFSASSDIGHALWDGIYNPNDHIEKIAASLTNALRTNDPTPPERMYVGTAYQLVYDIRWIWITLPAIMVGTSLFLLIWVVIRTNSSDVFPWKGSPLAYLFINIDEDISSGIHGQVEKYNGIERTVGRYNVALGRNTDGTWRLKKA